LPLNVDEGEPRWLGWLQSNPPRSALQSSGWWCSIGRVGRGCSRILCIPARHLSNRIDQMADPYVLLGVTVSSSAEEVRSAYLTLVEIYHPDRFGEGRDAARHEAQERLKSVNAAYDAVCENLKKPNSHGSAGPTAGSPPQTSPCPACQHPIPTSGIEKLPKIKLPITGESEFTSVNCSKCGEALVFGPCMGCKSPRFQKSSGPYLGSTICPKCPKRKAIQTLSCPHCKQVQTTEDWATEHVGHCISCSKIIVLYDCPGCKTSYVVSDLLRWSCPKCGGQNCCTACNWSNAVSGGSAPWKCTKCKAKHSRCPCGLSTLAARGKRQCAACGRTNRR
jgi:hypothetical protein